MGGFNLEIIKSILEVFFMGRKTKYSTELKLEIVKRYLKEKSNISLCNEYRIPYGKGKTMKMLML